MFRFKKDNGEIIHLSVVGEVISDFTDLSKIYSEYFISVFKR